ALEAVRGGESVVITTGTASGKSLCYMLPVLETAVADPDARALFIYPTKALAQDQQDALGEFGLNVKFGSYDGDTPQAARRLLRVIDADGAPRGPRRFVLWNPPLTDRTTMTRRSAYLEAGWLMAALLRRDVRTIAFTKARKITELVHRYTVDALQESPELAARISPYRAGYLPAQRREIEQRLFRGDLAGVVSTSALELGIDVGGLDASILVGFPGTMASVWQRAGRAGRGVDESLAVLIALQDALDQYLMRQPAYFFGRPVEHATVDPENPYVLAAHLRCA